MGVWKWGDVIVTPKRRGQFTDSNDSRVSIDRAMGPLISAPLSLSHLLCTTRTAREPDGLLVTIKIQAQTPRFRPHQGLFIGEIFCLRHSRKMGDWRLRLVPELSRNDPLV